MRWAHVTFAILFIGLAGFGVSLGIEATQAREAYEQQLRHPFGYDSRYGVYGGPGPLGVDSLRVSGEARTYAETEYRKRLDRIHAAVLVVTVALLGGGLGLCAAGLARHGGRVARIAAGLAGVAVSLAMIGWASRLSPEAAFDAAWGGWLAAGLAACAVHLVLGLVPTRRPSAVAPPPTSWPPQAFASPPPYGPGPQYAAVATAVVATAAVAGVPDPSPTPAGDAGR